MYASRIKKSDWLPLMRELREWGRTESILAQIAFEPETKGNSLGERVDEFHAARQEGGKTWQEWEELTVEVQVFDRGSNYLLRPLEKRVSFMERASFMGDHHTQKLAEWLHDHPSTKLVRYDNRTDVPPEDRRNEAVADWLDDQITAGMFMIFNVVTLFDFEMSVNRQIWARADAKK